MDGYIKIQAESVRRALSPVWWRTQGTKLILAAFVTVFAAFATSAQTSNATLNGTLKDQSGASIVGATVTATNTQTGIQKTETSDESGHYTILSLPPGFYDLQASQQGFTTVVRRNQELLVGTTATADFSLQISAVAQTVEVSATDTPIVETTQNTVSRILETKELDNLPVVTRSFSDLAALTPGVIINVGTVSAANISINNSPVGQTGYLLDGHSNENDFYGGPFVNVAQDWIQEFSVLTNQFPPEYGGAAAGIVSAVARSGTNDLHGRAYGFFQDAALNAKPSFLPKFAPGKPPYNSQRVGGMLGGPIKKDKLFFFGGFESYRNHTSIPIVVPAAFASIPGSSGVFPQTNTSKLAILKLEYHLTNKDLIVFRSNLEYDNAQYTGAGAAGSLVHILGNSTSGFTPIYVDSLSWTRTVSPSSVNELYFLFQKNGAGSACNYASQVGPYTGGGPNATPYGDPVGYYAQVTYATAGVVTGCGVAYSNMNQANGRLGDAYTISKGNHTLKLGFEADREHIYTNKFRNNTDGQYVVGGTLPFDPTNAATYPISLYSFYEPSANTSWDFPTWEDSWFAQDSWRVNNNLTLNLGVRYDISFSNSEFASEGFTPNNSQGHPINNDYGDVAPRFGFAWTPFHNDKRTVIRGGAGLFYDQDHLQSASAYISGFSEVTNGFNLNATRPSLNPYCYATPSPCGIFTATPTVPAQYANDVKEVLAYALANYTLPDFTPPGGTVTLGGHTYAIDPLPLIPGPGGTTVSAPVNFVFNFDKNYKVPVSTQIDIGFEHQFSAAFDISGDFTYERVYNGVLLQNENINPTTYGLLDPNYLLVEAFGNGGAVWSKHVLLHAGYRTHRGDTIQAAYTFGYADDNAVGGFITGSHTTMATDPFHYNVDKGPAPTDARNNLYVSSLVHIRWGVQFAPVVSYTSALPYNATTTQTTAGCQYFYTSCYPTGYTRNSLRGDQTFSLNARLSKVIRLDERRSVTAFFEGYNLTNKVNTGTNFQGNVQSATFEQPTGLASPRRQLQAGARFDF